MVSATLRFLAWAFWVFFHASVAWHFASDGQHPVVWGFFAFLAVFTFMLPFFESLRR